MEEGIGLSQPRLTVLEETPSTAEWRIGYLNNQPAVGDAQGRWYRVPEDVIVPQVSQQLVWMIQQGEWSCIHHRHWNPEQVPATSPDVWLKDGPAFLEPTE